VLVVSEAEAERTFALSATAVNQYTELLTTDLVIVNVTQIDHRRIACTQPTYTSYTCSVLNRRMNTGVEQSDQHLRDPSNNCNAGCNHYTDQPSSGTQQLQYSDAERGTNSL